MSRALRCLQVLETRLLGVNGQPPYINDLAGRLYMGREDLFGQAPQFPCASILEGEEIIVDRRAGLVICDLPVTVHGAVTSMPDSPLVAGYGLFDDFMRALFPEAASTGYGDDRLDGNAMEFTFDSRDILPREDGGKTTSVFIDLRIKYVMHPSNPDK